jgi:hypothetical protein
MGRMSTVKSRVDDGFTERGRNGGYTGNIERRHGRSGRRGQLIV